MANIGNSFNNGSVAYGHARKVWREIHDIYPAGGKLKQTTGFTKLIPAGTPVKFDMVAKEITPYAKTAITGASDVSTLGINGYLQEDIDISAGTIAQGAAYTGTVVYRGELYDFMLDADVVAKVKGVVPGVVFVH